MIEFVLAAAMLWDATPQSVKPTKAVQPTAASARPASSSAILAGVAVTLECTARADGRVEGCRVLGETHPGMGFGEAAVALMRDARVDAGPRDVQFARTIQFTP
ncbi:MAG TPA: TonB family protein [Brevundimonas sp.]|jgi:TonB family protein|uniref:TonB family protein n=1 Tax=Brevundimonas sp. TaxID=1871086 RepID=UPI002EDB2CB7